MRSSERRIAGQGTLSSACKAPKTEFQNMLFGSIIIFTSMLLSRIISAEIWHTTRTQNSKGNHHGCPKLLILLEPVEGFEPPTRILQILFSTFAEYA
jgi:hypothetical protein